MLPLNKRNYECLIHFAGTKNSLCPFVSKKRFETFLCCCEEWLQFDEAASIIAKNSLQVCSQHERSENCEQYFFIKNAIIHLRTFRKLKELDNNKR